MSSEKGSSKADTLVKVVLVFFISLLSFSVGTFVGKQVSDSDHRRMALEGEYKGERSIASTDEHAEGHGDKITEKEVESLTEEFVNKEKGREPAEAKDAHGEAHEAADAKEHKADGYTTYQGKKVAGAADKKTEAKKEEPKKAGKDAHAAAAADAHGKAADAHGKDPAHAAPGAIADAASKAAAKVVEGKAPTDGKKEERKPQSVLPSVASSAVGKYAVQVASYADEKEAKDHAADMKGKGFNAFYLPANVNGKTWYRVLVGLFSNMKSADEFRAQLMKEAGTKSAIVQKIVQ
ncbi:MAG: SPOR domain-containing protein [Bdellovibrionales bacterium]|nr:SPOR domain-containing protein [Bdellovibrionales bacterium]